MALKTKTPILPVSVVGAEETYMSLARSDLIAKLIGFPFFPITPTFPELPKIDRGASLKLALLEMTQKGLGMTAVVDAANKVVGVFTDGDLRRALEHALDLQQARVTDLMTHNPKTIRADELPVAAVEKMDTLKINGLLVVDADNTLLGALNMHDLLKAGVV